jgi:xanthine dehydrogenase accessory factor
MPGRAPHGVRFVERLGRTEAPLWVFGAGHVGQALVRIFLDLPVSLTWLDTRTELLPGGLPERVRVERGDPVANVARAPPGARYLVLTHSHSLDYALCRSILARGDFGWAGLIGSKSKAARFRARLAREGFGAASIARLVCPIGVAGIASKSPAAIAVAVAAQLLQDLDTWSDADLQPGSDPQARADSQIRADPGACEAADCSRCGQAALETLAR